MSARANPSRDSNTMEAGTEKVQRVISNFLGTSLLCVVGVISVLSLAPHANAAQPVDVVFVLDNSGSMKTNDPAFLTRRAVSDFARALAQDTELEGRIGIVLFDEQARLAQALIPANEIVSSDLLSRALAELDFSGQRTNSPAAIERALYELRENGREDAHQAIVFLSDGQIDTGDAQNDLEVARWLREDLAGESEASGIRIFGIAFTDGADYQLMQALARRTRAKYYRAFEASELAAVVSDVLATVDEFPADAQALDPSTPRTTAADVSAAPPGPGQTPDADSGSGLVGWLPIALLLVGGAIYLRRRDGNTLRDADHSTDMEAPPAQLLDPGGLLGEAGGALRLNPARTTIGRDPKNDIVLNDDTISSEHAVIEAREGRYWLQNLRSTNGTRLADKRLAPDECLPLKGGDHIRFADVDLMFVVEGYVPGGATVYLSSSTMAGENGSDTPSADARLAEERERLDPASVVDLDKQLGVDADVRVEEAAASDPVTDGAQAPEAIARTEAALAAPPREPHAAATPETPLALLPKPEPESDSCPGEASEPVAPEVSPADDIAVEATALRECLDYHLARVSEISPAFAAFVEHAFDQELRSALPVAATALLADARRSGRVEEREYTLDRTRYLICGVPAPMDSARALFVESYGGFTRLLAEQLQAESFQTDRCEILALISFGYGDSPWVSLTIVPDDGQDPRIDLLSYELLTEQERQEIEPSVDAEISQSGLA